MATSLVVPVAYISVLVTALAIFSRIYRRRKAAEQTSFQPWFPDHATRDVYISLLSADPPVPDSLVKSALLTRAATDVRRIWRLRDDKGALTSLHQRGLVGDDIMARFAAAEKELEAEIIDVVREADSFRQGWGQILFATATEMVHSERTRELVMQIPHLKAAEDKRLAVRAKYLPQTSSAPTAISNGPTPAGSGAATPAKGDLSAPQTAPGTPSPATPQKLDSNPGSDIEGKGTPALSTPAGTPSKSTPGSKKKKGKK